MAWMELFSTVSTSRYLPPPRSIHNLKETEEKEKKRFLPPSTQATTEPHPIVPWHRVNYSMRHVTLEDATAALRSQRTAACTACNHAGAAIDSFLDELKSKQALRQTQTNKQTNKQTKRAMRTVVRTDSLLCGAMCDGRSVRVARMRVRCMLSRVVWHQYAMCRMGPIRSGTNCPPRRRSTRTRTRPTCAFARLTRRTSLIRLDI
jgi:hypothetical protein